MQIPGLVALEKKLSFGENVSVKTPHTLGAKTRGIETNL